MSLENGVQRNIRSWGAGVFVENSTSMNAKIGFGSVGKLFAEHVLCRREKALDDFEKRKNGRLGGRGRKRGFIRTPPSHSMGFYTFSTTTNH